MTGTGASDCGCALWWPGDLGHGGSFCTCWPNSDNFSKIIFCVSWIPAIWFFKWQSQLWEEKKNEKRNQKMRGKQRTLRLVMTKMSLYWWHMAQHTPCNAHMVDCLHLYIVTLPFGMHSVVILQVRKRLLKYEQRTQAPSYARFRIYFLVKLYDIRNALSLNILILGLGSNVDWVWDQWDDCVKKSRSNLQMLAIDELERGNGKRTTVRNDTC